MTTVAAPTLRASPQPPGPVSASLTFGWRALLKIRRVPEQLADSIMIPILFTVLFTYLFGGALSGAPGDYLQFLCRARLSCRCC